MQPFTTARTAGPSRPQVRVHAARLLSALGADMTETLARLASPADLPDALGERDVRVPDACLEEARARLAAAGIPAAARTRSLLIAAAGALPLADLALAAGCAPADLGIVIGSTTAGTAEAIEILRTGDEPAGDAEWLSIEIGRTAEWLARAVGAAGPVYTVSTACTAGAKAILEGERLLRSGRAKVVIAGGSDALSPMTAEGFSALGARSPGRALPFDARRSGMHLGEGGGYVLMSLDPGLIAGDPGITLAGGGETSDAHHICAPHPDGAGARSAILAALGGRAPETVGFALLHGTATQQNDVMEARAMAAACPGVPAASLKRHVGHQLAGAGAFNAAVAWGLLAGMGPAPLNFPESGRPDPALDPEFLAALTRPGSPAALRAPCALASAFAFGGSNAALLLERAGTSAP